MKIISTTCITAVSTLACMISASNAQGSASSMTSLSGSGVGDVCVEAVNRTDVPVGAKIYLTGLSTTKTGPNRCAGVLITPKHVLTTAGCMSRDVRWASVGAQSYNRSHDGDKIRVKAMLTHPESTSFTNDFMILELEEPSSHIPVALAAADDSDTKAGEWGVYIGWEYIQRTATAPPTRADRLQSVNVTILSNEECSTMITIDKSNVCARVLQKKTHAKAALAARLSLKSLVGTWSLD